jgi:hypothetical protein
MNEHQWTALLMPLPIRIYSIHFTELALFIVSVFYRQRLKRARLGIIVSLVFLLLVSHLVVSNSSLNRAMRFPQLVDVLIIVLGIYLYPSIKRSKLQILLFIIALKLARDALMREYSFQGRYNLFMENIYYITIPFFFYVLFSAMLNLNGQSKKIYLFLGIASQLFFLRDYFTHDDSRYSYLTIVILHLQCIALSCWVISKLVMKERSIPMVKNPFFWISAGSIGVGIVSIVCGGLHPFLVAHYIQIYKTALLGYIQDFFELIVDLCYLYAIILCGKRYPDRLTFSKLFQNKAPRH